MRSLSIVRPGHTVVWGSSLMTILVLGSSTGIASSKERSGVDSGEAHRLEDCTFTATGKTDYFVLEPGHQLVYEGSEAGTKVRWVHTVLDKTETLDVPGTGKVEVRGVDERQWVRNKLTEISTTFYAICKETRAVFEFGEDVFVYNVDRSVTHEGSWRAGKPHGDEPAEPELYLPGSGGDETKAAGQTVTTPAGTFEHCVNFGEEDARQDDARQDDAREDDVLANDAGANAEFYAPGVGSLGEGVFQLIEYGYNIVEIDPAPVPGEMQGQRTRKISDRRAKEIALATVPGEVMDIAIERKLGAKRIVVEVIAAADLAETDVIIDMETGEVLAIEK